MFDFLSKFKLNCQSETNNKGENFFKLLFFGKFLTENETLPYFKLMWEIRPCYWLKIFFLICLSTYWSIDRSSTRNSFWSKKIALDKKTSILFIFLPLNSIEMRFAKRGLPFTPSTIINYEQFLSWAIAWKAKFLLTRFRKCCLKNQNSMRIFS